jgi:predicted DsbA family dithiol-disulfide isomerase
LILRQKATLMRLDIFSDPICPWCYIGKANLERALESRPEHPFVIQWHPFQLNPDMPKSGADQAEFLEQKFKSKAKTVEILAQVEAAARQAGIKIDFAAISRVPNTMDAHRLIHWADIQGRQAAMVSAIFRAYWQEGRDIGDPQILAQLAGSVGLDQIAIERLLNTDADYDDLQARDMDARQKGVRAVPTFLIAQHYVLSGAQPTAMWQQIIDELIEKTTAQQADPQVI